MDNDKSELNEFYDHTVSVDEVLSYYFESLTKHSELHDVNVVKGMASDEELDKDFTGFYGGWVESSVDTNPSLEEIRPELSKWYRTLFDGSQQKQ